MSVTAGIPATGGTPATEGKPGTQAIIGMKNKQGHQQSKHSNSGIDSSSRRVNKNIRDANSEN